MTPIKAGYLYSAHWCQSEVCNGGFYQFFYNTTGILAPEAVSAFEAMDLEVWRDILHKAMNFFGEVYPRERSLRLEMLPMKNGRKREDYDPFYALDEQFYGWLNGEDCRWERAADRFADYS
jgi:hypothetical protein